MRGRAASYLATWMLVVVASTFGCDAFDTREAVSPDEEQSTWVVPSVPQRVFTNLETGIEELNGVNYERSLQDNFTFEPLPDEVLRDPTLQGKFDNWTRDVEVEVLNRILAENREATVVFSGIVQIRDELPFADFQVDYVLTLVSRTQPPDTVAYQGKAQFDMRDGSKGWQLIKWTDIARVDGFETWGFLRGTLRQ